VIQLRGRTIRTIFRVNAPHLLYFARRISSSEVRSQKRVDDALGKLRADDFSFSGLVLPLRRVLLLA